MENTTFRFAESPTRISQGWSLLRARVELPKLGNWRLQRAERCVALSGYAPWDGLRILAKLAPENHRASQYRSVATMMPNQKTAP
eukprot:3158673-Prymnesium_polylepis.1